MSVRIIISITYPWHVYKCYYSSHHHLRSSSSSTNCKHVSHSWLTNFWAFVSPCYLLYIDCWKSQWGEVCSQFINFKKFYVYKGQNLSSSSLLTTAASAPEGISHPSLGLLLCCSLLSLHLNCSHLSRCELSSVSSSQQNCFSLFASISLHHDLENALKKKGAVNGRVSRHLLPFPWGSEPCTDYYPVSENNCFIYFVWLLQQD